LSILDRELAGQLARDLPPAEHRRIVDTFAEDLRRLTAELDSACRHGDAAGLRAAAHAIAGAAATMGAVAIEATARDALLPGADVAAVVARLRVAAPEAVQALLALGGPAGDAVV
jgi:hypothetical protein